MPQSASSFDPLLITIVLATLAIGLPILFALAIRFLWDRNVRITRSKELEKLIWQLHRIATAMEHQLHLAFPAVQPGTEEPQDLAYLQQIPQQAAPSLAPGAARSASVPAGAPAGASPQAAAPAPAAQQQQPPSAPPLEISTDGTRHGVNSMFGL